MTSDREQHSRTSMHADASAWGEMLSAAYRDIADRTMRDLPIFNEALSVEAIALRAREGRIVGMMVTPWFMNVVTPMRDGISQSSPGPGSNLRLRFPAGEIEFTVSDLVPVGSIASYSLFSPMFEFEDMASARATAEAALAALMSPANRAASHGTDAPHISSFDRRHFLHGVLTERRA
ncbi:[NiFe]-hydrogenase assembly chaperone HybE [Bradyrhizobium sp. sBnM-33]|uniref:[NiFe]-hydrogenase assembly chaperone HybE n=1 Tax=Bradyrhizobium sp. sBnM-33 TaxID=2831780 RepID=UPI0020BE4C59|nr:[NiFe]-hydrogenase assembly chaperone HybE [Bradyrhizobium sp. sBnM-33]WOH52215.1 [NiFe]-hydrogenase assembly chaperone HybE [Bradyrhizobium sp. sBnM-33]